MDNQKMFLSLMKNIMQGEHDISMNDIVSKSLMEKTCNDLRNIAKDGELIIEPENYDENGFEFLPFCCSGGENEKFDFVWVGMNPGIGKGRWPQKFYWEKTKWQDMADFYAPKGKVSHSVGEQHKKSSNLYQWIAEKGIWSEFYQVMIRFHFYLMENKKYDTWAEFKKEFNNDESIAEEFLTELDKHPTLNMELIPFKSRVISFNGTEMLKNSQYMCYFNSLLEFIDANAKKDAWIFFFGNTIVVKRLLKKQKKFKLDIASTPKKVMPKEKMYGGRNFYLQWWGERKLILSPFLHARDTNGKNIADVIKTINDFYKTT